MVFGVVSGVVWVGLVVSGEVWVGLGVSGVV